MLPHILGSLSWGLDRRVIWIPFTNPSHRHTWSLTPQHWGASLGTFRTQGRLSAEELSLHVSVRELRAVQLACQEFLPHTGNMTVSILMGNTSAMYYINRSRSSPTMSGGSLSMGILHFTLNRDQCFIPARGAEPACGPPQQVLLHSSRVVPMPRCCNEHLPQVGFSPHRSVRHMFQLEEPAVLLPEGSSPGSMTDAFLKKWSHYLFYAFPPILLMHKVLTKIKQDRAWVILIAPACPRQHLYTSFIHLSLSRPQSSSFCTQTRSRKTMVGCSTRTSELYILRGGICMAEPQ